VAVSQAMIPAIVRTQVTSLLLALAGAFVAVCLLARSLVTGLLAVAPAAVAVLWVFGFMGWAGIPLGVATSMFCAITLGIGVDYAIHFLERRRRRRQEGHPAPVSAAVADAGPAIVADTAAIALGFGLLGISQVPANARLGLLVALALASGCLLTLVGLGALLHRERLPQAAPVGRAAVEGESPG
jgi:predicted RND superfamily exporter protein